MLAIIGNAALTTSSYAGNSIYMMYLRSQNNAFTIVRSMWVDGENISTHAAQGRIILRRIINVASRFIIPPRGVKLSAIMRFFVRIFKLTASPVYQRVGTRMQRVAAENILLSLTRFFFLHLVL